LIKKKEKLRLPLELIKNARKSDREIAKALKISQPTVNGKEHHWIKKGTSESTRSYLTLKEWATKLPRFLSSHSQKLDRNCQNKRENGAKNSRRLFLRGGGEGLGMHSIMVSVHKNYASFSKLITKLREDWQSNLKDIQSFLMSVSRKELVYKPFSFRYLEETHE
jgi:hypothetical protein